MNRPNTTTLGCSVDLLRSGAGPRFEMLGYSGAVVERAWGSSVWDLAGMSAPSRLAILLEHDVQQVVGHSTRTTIDRQGVKLSGPVYPDEPAGEKVRSRSAAGFPWHASIRVTTTKWEELGEGQTAVVNGRTITGPCSIARESRLSECSFVAIPADENTYATAMAHDVDPDPIEAMLDARLGRGTLADQALRRRPAANANEKAAEILDRYCDPPTAADLDIERRSRLAREWRG